MAKDPIPRNDEKLVEFTKKFIRYGSDKTAGDAPEWPIPKDVLPKLAAVYAEFEDKFQAYQINNNPGNCKDKNTAKKALRLAIRVFLNGYIRKKEYVTDADYVNLGLPVPDTTRTRKERPGFQVGGRISYPGKGMLRLDMEILGEVAVAKDESWRFHIYYGFMPVGAATLEQAAGPLHYLMKAPLSGAELPFDVPPAKPSHKVIEFGTVHSGETVFFSIRLENTRGESGPWGPVFSTVIP